MPKGFQKNHKINLGRKMPVSKETRLKMSMNRKGKPSIVLGKHWKIKDTSKMGHRQTDKTRRKISKNNWMKNHEQPSGEKHRNWKGGLTYSQKQEILAGRKKPASCELCGIIGRICFDHDHKTGKFRGWICVRCNFALGFARDNIDILKDMIKYLETY